MIFLLTCKLFQTLLKITFELIDFLKKVSTFNNLLKFVNFFLSNSLILQWLLLLTCSTINFMKVKIYS